MKKLIPIVLLFLIHFQCNCQEDTSDVSFVAYWNIGDTYDYEVTKIRYNWKNSLLTSKDSSTYISRLEIIDSTGSNYKIKWTYNSDIQNTFNIPQEALDEFSKYKITEVIYNTTELGEFIGIENWEMISKMMTELLKKVIEIALKNSNSDTTNTSERIQPLISLYQSKEAIEQLVFKELMLFHLPFGMAISPNKVYTYEESFPNMLGGEPLRGDGKLYIDSVDYKIFRCSFIQLATINPDDAKNLVLQLLRRMGASDEELNNAIGKANLDIKDINKFDYYYDPGIPVNIETERSMLIETDNEKQKRIDKIKIKLIN